MVRDRQKAQVTREKTRVTFSTGKRTQHCAMHRLLIFGVGAYFFFLIIIELTMLQDVLKRTRGFRAVDGA